MHKLRILSKVNNFPFAPGAGTPPPELAGRDELRATLRTALERARIGRPAKSAMLVGLRGVGKTVLLDRVREDALPSELYHLSPQDWRSRSRC